MSRIPDCRTDENYNQKYLDRDNSNVISGYDWCTEMAVDNFFDNFGDVDDEYLTHILSEKVPDILKSEYEMDFTFGDSKTEKRKIETYADLLRLKILEWIEAERDELITSMIDNMDEDEYKAIKEKVDGRTEKEVGQGTGENGEETV